MKNSSVTETKTEDSTPLPLSPSLFLPLSPSLSLPLSLPLYPLNTDIEVNPESGPRSGQGSGLGSGLKPDPRTGPSSSPLTDPGSGPKPVPESSPGSLLEEPMLFTLDTRFVFSPQEREALGSFKSREVCTNSCPSVIL